MRQWQKGLSGNLVIVTDAWVLSYKPNAGETSGMGYGEGEDAQETVLIKCDASSQRNTHFVLRGDHREAFQSVADQGWNALKAVYDQLKVAHISFYSADYPHEDMTTLRRCAAH